MVLLSGARDPPFKDLGVPEKGKLGDVGIFASVNLPNPTTVWDVSGVLSIWTIPAGHIKKIFVMRKWGFSSLKGS